MRVGQIGAGCVLAVALSAAAPQAALAQKAAPLNDILLAACVQGAKFSSDNPRIVDYVSGKAQPTKFAIIPNPKYTDIISVVATMKVGDQRRNVRCDFGRVPPNSIEFLAAQWDGRTYVGEANVAARPRMREPDDVKREDRFLGALYDIMRTAAVGAR
jgi:hypothetical protein